MKVERQLTWPCHDCAVRDSSFCSALIGRAPSNATATENQFSQFFATAARHEVIANEQNGRLIGPLVLCKGWAIRYYQFADGRRQILSVLIPGDLFFLSTLANERPDYAVQTVTETEICELRREDLSRQIASDAATLEAFSELCARERDELHATVINFNEPDPVNRVLNFARRLVNRLAARGIRIGADVYPFPLSPTEIADATALAVADVNRAFQFLRHECIADLSNNKLTILDCTMFENHLLPQVRNAFIDNATKSEIRLS